MRSKRLTIIISLTAAVLLIAVACTGEADDGPRVPTPEFNPTAAGEAAEAAPVASTDPEETDAGTTDPAATTASDPVEEVVQVAGPTGDPENGASVFIDNGCATCHSTGDNRVIGPGLAGVFARAESRGTGQTAEEYVFTSITDPSEFIVDDFPNAMPSGFGDSIPEGDLEDLIAYLATLN